jgi:uncharacterized delta-60 repeat protein
MANQSDFIIAQLRADGSPDPTFGGGAFGPGSGMVGVDFGGDDLANAVALEPDGRIVVAGRSNEGVNPTYDFAVARVLADGSGLDPTFNGTGRQFVDFGASAQADAVAIQPDGKIVLAGSDEVTRLNPDGTLDTTFNATGSPTPSGGNGRLTITFAGSTPGEPGEPAQAHTLGLQPDGRIVVAGYTESGTGSSFAQDFALARVNPDGTLDSSFGTGGKIKIALGATDSALNGVAIQPDGRIVAAGVSSGEFTLVRLLSLIPQPALVGGPADGTAVPLTPSGGSYTPGASITFFPGMAVDVRVAIADVNGDGIPDYIGGAGPGGAPLLAVLDGKTGGTLASFPVFEPGFTGGVYVAAADLDGDGKAEVVVTPDRGGGPIVAVYSGAKLAAGLTGDAAQLARFYGIDDPDFRGGARPALGDVNGDGRPDLVVAAGFGGGPRIAIFDGQDLATG